MRTSYALLVSTTNQGVGRLEHHDQENKPRFTVGLQNGLGLRHLRMAVTIQALGNLC